ncbi:hypothetical protein VTL71DRAFT_15887 [Oculimacula yallundae]|uniref:Carrier domain-containing protein n=1 Tax=Oculimacula yallundae TaxID=86028 RepID=A0ABR4CEA4_9HELO
MIIDGYDEQHFVSPSTDTEIAPVKMCSELFGASTARISINNDLFTLGASSVNILTLKRHLQYRLGVSVPITYFFSNLILRDLARSITDLLPKTTCTDLKSEPASASAYDPVVVLNPTLAVQKLRSVYALRARGFDPSDGGFYMSMSEIIQNYLSGIKSVGYSFGSILTFEITKTLQASGEEVKFLGTLDNHLASSIELKVAARDHDMEGMLKRMDVFYTGPLIWLVKAKGTEEWRRDFIGMWHELVEDAQYYEVKGTIEP